MYTPERAFDRRISPKTNLVKLNLKDRNFSLSDFLRFSPFLAGRGSTEIMSPLCGVTLLKLCSLTLRSVSSCSGNPDGWMADKLSQSENSTVVMQRGEELLYAYQISYGSSLVIDLFLVKSVVCPLRTKERTPVMHASIV